MFHPDLISQSCQYENKIVGMPFSIGYSMLYSNKALLQKYGKTIPETWDELIDTNSEHGLCSLIEFIYSCRNSVDSPFPDMENEIFHSDMDFALNSLFGGNALFIKFWTLPNSMLELMEYDMAPLPGKLKGVSGTSIAGYNIGIDSSISKRKINAAIEALKFLSSKELQKKYLLNDDLISGITELYKDEEVCKHIRCDAFLKVQPIGRPTTNLYSSTEYYQRIINYAHQYLYGNETASKALKQISDLTAIHFISMTKDRPSKIYAIIFFIIVNVLSFIFLTSIILLFTKKYKVYFDYLSPSFWIVIIIGLIIILSSFYTTIGPYTNMKCKLHNILLLFGCTMNISPFLHKLIVDCPERNKISEWASKHSNLFILIFMVIDSILSLITLINQNPEVETVIFNEGENFRKCSAKGKISLVIMGLVLFYYFFIVISILFLCYIEWCVKTYIYDVRTITIAIYFNVFSATLHTILYFTNFKNYIFYFIINNAFIIMSAVTSYIFEFGFRLFIPFNKKKENEVILYINTIYNLRGNKNNMDNNQQTFSSNIFTDISSSSNNTERSNEINRKFSHASITPSIPNNSFFLKLVNYHNQPINMRSSITPSNEISSSKKSNVI
ncbi:periplasmic binding protein-like II [Neocallimastix lanati (nom. inval.)]|nr:periplasmic binding protein-like II [Neocallimastix sp. JGI-2020a]